MTFSSVRRVVFAALALMFTMALVAASPAAAQLDFFTVTPCRVYDSRGTDGPLVQGQKYTDQADPGGIPVAGVCGVAADAVAASFNVTIVGATGSGELVVFPVGATPPTAGALSFNAGQTRAMFELISLGTGGAVDALATMTPSTPGFYQLVLDVTGYFRLPDAPEITTTAGTTAFTEDAGPVVVDAGITVTDPDDANLASATVSLVSAPDGAAETLNATACAGLTVTPGNPLTITGSQPLATYQTCLQSVTYDNTDQDPDTTDRTVNFVANDGTNNSNTATKTVSVSAVNDPPTITSSDTVSVQENQTAVIDVQSTDLEGDAEGAGLTYSLTGGADQALFSIVASTGVLTFNSAPDFENPADAGANNVYDVQVTVTDSGSQTDVQNLQVTVTNTGEPPTITSSATVSAPENQTSVIDVQSTDPEGDTEGAGLAYSITGGADAALFSIVASSGVLTFNSAPDFENPGDVGANNVYDVQVTVTDSTTLTDVQDLQVTVTNASEAPSITSSATPSVTENQTSVIDVQSTDPEGDTEGAGLTYSVTGGADAALFSIVASTGVLTFNSAPDFESPGDAGANNVYDVQVTVTDSTALTGVQNLQVTVTNQNEGPTITSSATVSVPENQTAATDVQSTDPDGETEGAGLTYSLTGGADQALFSIVASTGVLTFNSAPDFESPGDAGANNVYDVQVTVTDAGTLTDVQNLQVTVTNVNEAPTITSSATPSVAENQTAVIDVQSTDPEGDLEGAGLTYSITGGADQALFSIVASTGVLTFNSAPNFEAPADVGANNVYDVQVTVTDSGTQTGVQNLQVTVTNVNEAPSITSSATPSVPENQTGVIDVQSTDPEGDTEGSGLNYSITGGADAALFSIVASTGVLTFNSAPNFEAPGDVGANNVYDVQVTVTDSGAQTGVQNLQVTVTNVNEPPVANADGADITEEAPNVAAVNTVSGNVLTNDTDPEGGLTVSAVAGGSVGSPRAGTYGSVTINSNGSFTYTLDDTNPTVNALAPGGTLTDPFGYTASDGSFTSSSTLTVTIHGADDPATPDNDAYDFIGNAQVLVQDDDTPGTPHVFVDGNNGIAPEDVLDGDVDPDGGPPITISGIVGCADPSAPFDCVVAGQGTVSLQADGSFSFIPEPGDADPTATFQYTLTGNPAPGTVTLTRFERVWFVDPNAGGGNGTSATPFNSLDSLDGGADSDVAGDYIFVHDGTLALSGPMPMENNQHLIGEGVGLTVPITGTFNGSVNPNVSLVPAGTKPQLTNASGNTVTVTTEIPIEIVGLSLAGGTLGGGGACGSPTFACNAIDLTSAAALTGSGTLAIGSNEFRGAGAEGIDINLNASTIGTLNLNVTNNSWDVAGTHTGNAVDISRAAGTLRINFSNNPNILSSATAVNVAGGAAASTSITGFTNNSVHQNTVGSGIVVDNVTFDTTPGNPINQVSGGTTVIGQSGNGVGTGGMVLTNVVGDLAFTDLDIYNDSGTGLGVSSTGALNAGAGTGFRISVPASVATIDSNGGPAVSINNASISLPLNFLESTNSTTNGLSLVNAFGGVAATALSAGSGQISDPVAASGTAVNISGGNGNITLGIPITNNSGNAVVITGRTSDTVSFTGAITETGSGISLTTNGGSTISFRGGLSATTGANAAFTATGGGIVEVCDENPCNPGATGLAVNTLTTTTGTALNVANTTISSNNLEFRSISAGTGAGSSGVGISLDNTGTAAGSGGLVVRGTGTAGSGGTIQHKTGADGSTTAGIGIYLNNTKNAFFNWMQLNDFDNFAIRGFGVQGFTLNNSVINGVSGNNDGADEAVIRFDNLTVSGLIDNSTVQGGVETNIRVINNTGTLNALVIQNSTIRNNSTTTGGDGIFARAQSGATMTVKVLNCTLHGHRDDHIATDAENSGVMTTVITGNTLTSNGTIGAPPQASTLGGQITVTGGAAFSSTSTFNISNNIITGAVPAPITVNVTGTTSTLSGVLSGTISGNQLGQAGSANSGSSTSDGMSVIVNGAATINATITNNQIRQFNNIGMQFIKRDGSGNMNLTVTGNTVAEPVAPNALQGILVTSGATSGPPPDSGTVCADIGGAGALVNTVTGPNFGGDLIRVRQRFSTFVRLPGYGGGATDTTAVANYLIGRNTITNEAPNAKASATTQAPGSFITPGGGACTAGAAPL